MITLVRLGDDPRTSAARRAWSRSSAVREGHALVVAVSGEADLATGEQLREQLASALATGPEELVVDLSGLTFCDTVGLDVLQEATALAVEAGVPMSYRGMSPSVLWLSAAFPLARPGRVDLPAAGVPEPRPPA